MNRVTPNRTARAASVVLTLIGVLCVASAFALSNSTGPNGCNAQAVHALGYTGQGVKIGLVTAQHALVTHEAFFDKDENGYPVGNSCVSCIDTTSENIYSPLDHDTNMAGIIASRGGQLYPNDKGAAPSCSIINAKISAGQSVSLSWVQAALDQFRTQGCRVIATGVAFSSGDITPDGQNQWSSLYDYYAYQYGLIFANAAGNESNTIAVFGDAYNGITTGGLIYDDPDVYRKIGAVSGSGLTVDGRRKPEAAAPAYNQRVPTTGGDTVWTITYGQTEGYTSWAVPHTAGVAAVLLSYADTTTEPDDGKSEVIKAVIVNSTFPNILAKNGSWTDPANTTWHPERGYGRLDTLRAYQTLAAGKVVPGSLTQQKGWAYRSFKEKNAFTEQYAISGSKNQRLITTLTWHRKVSQSLIPESNSLNISLTIYDPQGQQVISLTGGKDNLRKADILLQQDGIYEVRISKSSILWGQATTRYYALAFELLDPLEGDWNTDYKVDLGDLTLLWDCWLEGCALDAFELLSAHWLAIDARYAAP